MRMSSPRTIKDALERNAKLVAARPSIPMRRKPTSFACLTRPTDTARGWMICAIPFHFLAKSTSSAGSPPDMEPRLQRRVQRYGWNKAAASYESFWSEQLRPAQDLMLSLADLQPSERVLDVACGTGLVTFRAADVVGPRGFVAASDMSEDMVASVAAAAAARGITGD